MSSVSTVRNSSYIHGTTAPEQDRLSLMNRLMNQAALDNMKLVRDCSILDVGAGLGQLARAMARVSGGRAVGVERELAQLEKARDLAAQAGEASLVDFRMGEATALPLHIEEIGSFDVAHARFILEHVPDPLAVVKQMALAIRPGGRVVLQDDDHDVLRLWPEPPGFYPVWQAYTQSYVRLGNDPYVGRKLVQFLTQAGLQPTTNDWIFFGSCAGHENFAGLVENMVVILQGARTCVLEQGLLTEKSYDEGLLSLETWRNRPDCSIWFSICYAEGKARSK
jgi:SAM-dependent methyltransferase